MLGRKVTPKRFYEFSLEAQVPSDHLLRASGRAGPQLCRRLTRGSTATPAAGGRSGGAVQADAARYLYGITSEAAAGRGGAPAPGLPLVLGVRPRRDAPDTRCCPRRGRASACPCTRRLSPRWCGSASGPAWCRATSSTWTTRWSRPMPVLGRPARRHCSLSCRARPGTSRRCGGKIPSPIPRRQRGPPGEEQPAPDSAGGLTAGAAARHRCTWPVEEDVPNGDQGPVNALVTSRTDPDAGLVKREGGPYAFYYKAHVGVDGGRARLITALDVTRARLPTSTCWTGCSRSIEARRAYGGRSGGGYQVQDLRQLRGAGAAGHPGEHPAPQHHERPG